MYRRALCIALLVSGTLTASGVLAPTDDAPLPLTGAPISGPAASRSGTAKPARRYVVGLHSASTPGQKAETKASIRTSVSQQLGKVALESLDEANPFMVVESITKEHADSFKGAKGVSYVEEDAVRRPMVRRLHAGASLTAATRTLLQQGPMQPYGLASVQADLFPSGKRSTTSSIDSRRKFPICIIDTGIDATHPALRGVKVTDGDPSGYSTDSCGHGTHVAGTISARSTLDGVLNGEVELVIIKVFDLPYCEWTYASTLTVAMQKCQQFGAKIVSMSLGGIWGSAAERTQTDRMYQNGMLLFAAAGNFGNSSTEYPAGYAGVVSVAATDSSNDRAEFSNYNADVELSAPGVNVLSSWPTSLSDKTMNIAVENGITLDTADLDPQIRMIIGSPVADFSGTVLRCNTTSCPPTIAGKVCVIPRGDVSFCQKATFCAEGGGVAAIVYNNRPGLLRATLGDSCPIGDTIPSLIMLQELELQFPEDAKVTGAVGPPWPYAYLSGTSMATPHASAVAALVWGQNPACSNAVIRCALQRSALDLTADPATPGRDNYYGFGLVHAKDTTDKLAQPAPQGGCGLKSCLRAVAALGG